MLKTITEILKSILVENDDRFEDGQGFSGKNLEL